MSMIPAGSLKAATGPNLNIVCKFVVEEEVSMPAGGSSFSSNLVFYSAKRSVRLTQVATRNLNLMWDTLHGGGVARKAKNTRKM
jgi:hypothetical protein